MVEYLAVKREMKIDGNVKSFLKERGSSITGACVIERQTKKKGEPRLEYAKGGESAMTSGECEREMSVSVEFSSMSGRDKGGDCEVIVSKPPCGLRQV